MSKKSLTNRTYVARSQQGLAIWRPGDGREFSKGEGADGALLLRDRETPLHDRGPAVQQLVRHPLEALERQDVKVPQDLAPINAHDVVQRRR